MLKRVFIVLLLAITAFVPSVAAQTAATVSGIVEDSTGAVLPGVTVTARSGLTGLTRTAVTGPEGRYVLAQLPPGTYEIRAEVSGFKPHVRPEITLTVAQSLTLNLTLQVGLRWFDTQYGTQFHYLMAGSVVAMFPTIVVFLVAQKHFIQGITLPA